MSKRRFVVKTKDIGIGDIIMLHGKKHVLVYTKIREDCSSTAYHRDYFFCPMTHFHEYCMIRNSGRLTEKGFEELKNCSTVARQRGTEHDEYEVCEDEAPFEIKPVKAFMVRRKKKKTVTTYE